MAGRVAFGRDRLRQPSVAELVATELRASILHGDIGDGESLPTQDELCQQFEVGRVAIREALRILENEGLATVRRGNTGGATVHSPGPGSAARMLAMVMEARSVQVGQLAIALQEMEPLCASMCAENPDRSEAVIPRLREVLQRSVAVLDDAVEFTRASRVFHELLVEACGNDAMVVMVGSLEAIWSPFAEEWARRADFSRTYPDLPGRRSALRAHERITTLIEQGDASAVARFTRDHVRSAQRYSLGTADSSRPVTIAEFC